MPYPYIPLAAAQPPWVAQGGDPTAVRRDDLAMPGPSEAPGPSGPQDYGYNTPQSIQMAGIQSALAGTRAMPWGEPIPSQYIAAAQKLKQYIEPGPLEQRYMQQEQNLPEVHGLKQRLAALGKGLLMGGPLGLAMGAADPNMVARAWHRSQLPGLAQGAQAEQQSRAGVMRRVQEIATNTGIDPITGLKTPMSAYHQAMAGLGYGRLGVQQDRAQTARDVAGNLIQRRTDSSAIDRRKADVAELNAQIHAWQVGGTAPSNDDIDAFLATHPHMRIPYGFDPARHSLFVDSSGNEQIVPTSGPQAGQAKQVVGATGAPVGSSKKTDWAVRQSEGTKNRASREGIATANRAVQEQKLTDAEEKDIDKQARAKHKLPPFHDPALDASNEAAIEQERQQMRAAKLQQRAKGGGSAPTYPPLTRTNMKAGGTYTYQGKRVRVAELSPDGKFRLEVVP